MEGGGSTGCPTFCSRPRSKSNASSSIVAGGMTRTRTLRTRSTPWGERCDSSMLYRTTAVRTTRRLLRTPQLLARALVQAGGNLAEPWAKLCRRCLAASSCHVAAWLFSQRAVRGLSLRRHGAARHLPPPVRTLALGFPACIASRRSRVARVRCAAGAAAPPGLTPAARRGAGTRTATAPT